MEPEYHPARRHGNACGAGRRAAEDAHLRCAIRRDRECHGHPHLKQSKSAVVRARQVYHRGALSALEAKCSKGERSEKKRLSGTGGQRAAPAQSRAERGRGRFTLFKTQMQHSKTPAGISDYSWWWRPLKKAHLFVCKRPRRRDSRPAATIAANAAAAVTTAEDATGSGSRGREGRMRRRRRVAPERRTL